MKDELYTDVAVLLRKNGYPPTTIDDAYDEIMKQVENYKKYVGLTHSKSETMSFVAGGPDGHDIQIEVEKRG